MRMNSGQGRARKAGRLGVAALLAAGALGATAATAAARPAITVTPASNLDPTAPNAVDVAGTGFTTDALPAGSAGAYIAVTATVGGAIVTDNARARYFPNAVLASGVINATLSVERRFTPTGGGAEVDCLATQCSVTSWPAHGLPRADNLLANRAIAFDLPAPGTPEITVTPKSDIPREGETTLEISGTGFDPNAADANGFYVGYGPRTADFWLNAGTFGATKWIQPGATPSAARATLNPDGSFRTTLTIAPTYTRGGTTYDCRVVECAILTFAAHGSADRSQDTVTALTFVPPPPVVEVSPVTGLDRNNPSIVTVRGSSFSTGTYVSLAAVVNGEVVTPEQTAAKWIRRGGPTPEETLNADGSFTTTVSVIPTFTPRGGAPVDCRVTTCVIATWRQHSNPTVAALYTSTALAFAAAPDVRPEPRPEPKPAPEATVTKVKAQTLGSKRGARIGFVTCKADCTVATPKSVKVKIGKKKYTAKVVAPKNANAGKRVQIRVTLTKAAAKALAGRSAKISVNVKLTANGQTETKKVTATVKAKKAKKAAKKQAAKKQATAKR